MSSSPLTSAFPSQQKFPVGQFIPGVTSPISPISDLGQLTPNLAAALQAFFDSQSRQNVGVPSLPQLSIFKNALDDSFFTTPGSRLASLMKPQNIGSGLSGFTNPGFEINRVGPFGVDYGSGVQGFNRAAFSNLPPGTSPALGTPGFNRPLLNNNMGSGSLLSGMLPNLFPTPRPLPNFQPAVPQTSPAIPGAPIAPFAGPQSLNPSGVGSSPQRFTASPGLQAPRPGTRQGPPRGVGNRPVQTIDPGGAVFGVPQQQQARQPQFGLNNALGRIPQQNTQAISSLEEVLRRILGR